MTRRRLGLFGASALIAALAGCATPPVAGGGVAASLGRAPAPVVEHPGPGWLLLGSNEEGEVYMHPRSTVRIGSSAFIMVVGSKRQPVVLPGGVQVGSVRERIEIDCDKRLFRRDEGTAHPDLAALGPVLGRVGRQAQWKGMAPDTVIGAVASAVCSVTAPDPAPPEPGMPRFPRARPRTFST